MKHVLLAALIAVVAAPAAAESRWSKANSNGLGPADWTLRADLDGDGYTEPLMVLDGKLWHLRDCHTDEPCTPVGITEGPVVAVVVGNFRGDEADDLLISYDRADGVGTWIYTGELAAPPAPPPAPSISSSVVPNDASGYQISFAHNQDRAELSRFYVAIWNPARTVPYLSETEFDADLDPELTCGSSSCTLWTPVELVPGTFVIDIRGAGGPDDSLVFSVF